MFETGNKSLVEGIIFTVVVVVICAIQWIRYNIVAASHSISVKSKAILGV